jgi:hypothetical protein
MRLVLELVRLFDRSRLSAALTEPEHFGLDIAE